MVIVLRSSHRVQKKKHKENEKATEMFKYIFVMTAMVFADMFVQREYDLAFTFLRET